ncbi:MAG: guanylate kinase [Rickettsiales bacterium]|nr:guanylate kinase [Rickettsiales bacterium]|tara:strand:- start:316 stop:918 length:603 start_codon:yes stop_codon:yes gene_type:complete
MLVLSSPSAAGKTTLSRALMVQEQEVRFSVSVTTRPKRPSEVEGVDYHFVDDAHFQAMQAAGDLLETSTIYGYHYATPAAQVEATLAAGQDMIFELDAPGMLALKKAKPQDVVSVFILPPSLEELEQRLRQRAQDDEAVMAKRLAQVAQELAQWEAYDFVIINHDLTRALQELSEILHAERQRRHRMTGLRGFISRLIQP